MSRWDRLQVDDSLAVSLLAGFSAGPRSGGLDILVANTARVSDYLLGGKDSFPVDRAAADAVLQVMPSLVEGARANRDF